VGTPTALRAGVSDGQVELAVGRVRVVLAAGAGQERVEKFFVRVTEC